MLNNAFRTIFVILICVFLAAASVISLNDPGPAPTPSDKALQDKLNQIDPSGVVVSSDRGVVKVVTDINSLPLKDNPEIYQFDDPGSVVTMYVTVRRGNDMENTNHTWQEVNSASKFFFENMEHVTVPAAEAILQIGDETGPLPGEFGYDEVLSNATIQIRGGATSVHPQKSYKISLFESAGEWRGQKVINLNKHIFDPTRVKNKLAFDLMKGIPDMVSLRTQFVHLYVKDETTDPPSQAFEDYGLFTQVEQPNKKFLRNHYLDRYGQLYKAIMFEFFRYPEQIRMADDPLYDEKAFSTVLEIKGNKDHTKLIEMLDAVNNWGIPIEETFEKYFDADNYFTWMAFNILVNNFDTDAQNFYLYSPQNGEKWYFLPWDYDLAFSRQVPLNISLISYQKGVATYWNGVLHHRVLLVPEYRAKLDEKINMLMDYLTPERLNQMTSVYRAATDQYVFRMPDVQYLPATPEEYDAAYKALVTEPQVNYQLYRESLESPMPFFLDTPQIVDDVMQFSWGEAYDFDAQDITYHFVLSNNWDFNNPIADAYLTNTNFIEIPVLQPGVYFWKVTAVNEDGKMQYAFDYYHDSEDNWHFGVKYLYISPEGEILEKLRE